MRFIGIRNSPAKARLLAEGTPAPARERSGDLAWDCIRHLDFLRRGDGDPRATLYWRYLVASGRSPQAADARCERFAALAEAIRAEGFDPRRDPVAVTGDGMRLNGSHRVAIASLLGVEELEVRSYSWRDVLPRRLARPMVEEARVKRAAQEEALGREALDRRSGEALGRVAFVDAELPPRILAALGWRARPLAVVERADGSLEPHRLDDLTLR